MAALLVGARQRLVHEHHVGVAGVRHLAAAEPAHRDDGDAGRERLAPLGLDRRDRGDQAALEGGPGDVGQRLPDCVDVDQPEHVGGRDPEQLAPAHRPHRGDRLDRVGVPAAPRAAPRWTSAVALARQQVGVVGEQRGRLRRAQQQVGGVPAGGQQVREPLGRGALVAQHPQVPVRRARARRSSVRKPSRPRVGVGRLGEPAQHRRQQLALDRGPARDTRGQRLEVAQGAAGSA